MQPLLEAHEELRGLRDRSDHEPLDRDGLHEVTREDQRPVTPDVGVEHRRHELEDRLGAGDRFQAGLLPRPEVGEHDPAEIGGGSVVSSEDVHRNRPAGGSRVSADLTLLFDLDAASPGVHLGEQIEIRHVEEDREPDAGDPAEDRVELHDLVSEVAGPGAGQRSREGGQVPIRLRGEEHRTIPDDRPDRPEPDGSVRARRHEITDAGDELAGHVLPSRTAEDAEAPDEQVGRGPDHRAPREDPGPSAIDLEVGLVLLLVRIGQPEVSEVPAQQRGEVLVRRPDRELRALHGVVILHDPHEVVTKLCSAGAASDLLGHVTPSSPHVGTAGANPSNRCGLGPTVSAVEYAHPAKIGHPPCCQKRVRSEPRSPSQRARDRLNHIPVVCLRTAR